MPGRLDRASPKRTPPYRPKAMPILKYNIIACHSIVFRALHRDHRLSRVELNDGKRASKSKRAREQESKRAREQESKRAREQESKRAREQESKRAREQESSTNSRSFMKRNRDGRASQTRVMIASCKHRGGNYILCVTMYTSYDHSSGGTAGTSRA